ncbi:MATE family efflux transporter [Paenibacillus sp. PR3]|uniref:MATE family efflux transporter n=1 Tax=Paenibacillus terricola TaxID=2763503 RepID=A0ABR8MZT9_9BACL|nr:MATE family efflux transporter [Paenibacillus terricola]MBD3921452.1 MATE family efflux transporter [Paenibacillus terricola]
MKGTHDLREGPITSTLMRLTLPVIATNFISTTYGLVNMFWIGKLGSNPVAAIGTANFFVNLAIALFTIVSIGTGIKVSHSLGAGKEDQARVHTHNGILMSLVMGTIFILIILATHQYLIEYFELGSIEIEQMASHYLIIAIIGTFFTLLNSLFSMVLTSMGNSRKPFQVQTVGFLVNLFLDPLFIFGVGNFNGFGVSGAALSTLIANVIVMCLFIVNTRQSPLFSRPFIFHFEHMKEVLRIGMPITVQRVAFTVISIIIAKIVVQWGPNAIAVQRVGIQIESISYMTIGGLQGAVAAFIGQNFGAHKHDRIKSGYRIGLVITSLFGMFVSILFMLFPEPIFALFLADEASLSLGVDYLQIIGASQLFMCVELMTVGAFNGIGKTYIPPIFSIILTSLRIPMAIVLSNSYGLNGVWISIALSSVLKGIILVTWFIWTFEKMNQRKAGT